MKEPNITIEEIQNMKLIYVRFRGTYIEFRKQSKKMFETLFKFVVPNTPLNVNENKTASTANRSFVNLTPFFNYFLKIL